MGYVFNLKTDGKNQQKNKIKIVHVLSAIFVPISQHICQRDTWIDIYDCNLIWLSKLE